MRYTEIIAELFQPGKNWEWKFRGSEEAIAEFEVGGRQYMWQAYSHVRINRPDKWEVQFRLLRNDADPEDLDLFGTTGTGNSAQVMSIAVDITRAFLQEYGDKVLELTFNAKENSRIALYTKMVKRLLPTWDMHQRYRTDTGMEYYLTNPRAYELFSQSKTQEVNEAFNAPYPMTWEHGDESHDALVKLPDGSNLSIMFSMDYGAYGDEEWTVEFWRGNSQDVTGEGDQQRIFATVLNAIQKFINKYHPERLRFSANKDVEPGQKSMSRTNLYNRLVQRYANGWGYTVDIDDFADTTVYNLHTMNEDVLENFHDGEDSTVWETTAAGINKMFNNLGDPVYANLQRVALLAMQGRQQEAHGRLNSVIKDSSPQVQKKIIDAVNAIKPVTINGKVADSSTLDKSKAHQDWILNTFIPWVQSLLVQPVAENFHDGKNPQDKGDSKRYGVPTKASISTLRKVAKQGGRKGQLAHWMANMKSGRAKAKK